MKIHSTQNSFIMHDIFCFLFKKLKTRFIGVFKCFKLIMVLLSFVCKAKKKRSYCLKHFTMLYSCVEKSWETSLIMNTILNIYIYWTECLSNKKFFSLCKNNKIFIMHKGFQCQICLSSFTEKKRISRCIFLSVIPTFFYFLYYNFFNLRYIVRKQVLSILSPKSFRNLEKII